MDLPSLESQTTNHNDLAITGLTCCEKLRKFYNWAQCEIGYHSDPIIIAAFRFSVRWQDLRESCLIYSENPNHINELMLQENFKKFEASYNHLKDLLKSIYILEGRD